MNYIDKYYNLLKSDHPNDWLRQYAKSAIFDQLQSLHLLRIECKEKGIDFAGKWPGLADDLKRYAALFTDEEYLEMCIQGGSEKWEGVDPGEYMDLIRGYNKEKSQS